jgi:hypothetical protein
MSNPVLLNNIDHRNLRVITTRSAAYGDGVMSALTFPDEFRTLQAHYPIVFRKHDDGRFEPLALFGFQEGENLFLDDALWDAADLPLSVERQPFLIGVDGEQLMVHVDLDSPRLGANEGEPVFLPQGGTTDYLERMNSTLLALHQGLQRSAGFIDALLEHGLLESFVLDIRLDDGSDNRLWGFYTIDEDRLAALDGAALDRLHRAGHLQPIYMAIASLSNFRRLIDRKNRRHADGR